MDKIQKTDDEWQKELTEEQYRVLRKKGTEPPFTGEYLYSDETGIYTCGACGYELFSSETKFDSHCGWPSFYDPMYQDHIIFTPDDSHGMSRIEVTCARCGGHLGHVFDDAPDQPTGKRYCINSTSLGFKKQD